MRMRVGPIRLKNRMRVRAMFAEFEEILIADWQYDELETPLNSRRKVLTVKSYI